MPLHAEWDRIQVFAFVMASSGVPPEWQARSIKSGVNWIEDPSERSVQAVGRQVSAHARAGDIVIASIHWGGNWGYGISVGEREFAHGLIEGAGVHLVHGHSSHHVKAIESHRGKLVLVELADLPLRGSDVALYVEPPFEFLVLELAPGR